MAKGLENKEQANKLISTYFGEKPVFTGFAQYILDIRRNLIALSFGVLTYKLSGATITAVQGIFWLNITGIKDGFIDSALFWYLWYNLSHFFIEVFIIYKSFQMLTKQYQNNITERREIINLDDVLNPSEKYDWDYSPDGFDYISSIYYDKKKKNIEGFLSIKKYLKTVFTDVLVPIVFALWAIYCVSPYQLIDKIISFYFEIALVSMNITLSLLFATTHCKLKFMMA